MKKFLIALGVAVVVVVLVFAGLLLTVKPERLINEHKDMITQKVSEQLGRKVELGQVKGSLFPILGASISQVRLAGPGQPQAPAQVELGQIAVRIQLWPALISMGKDLRVDAIELRGLKVVASRDKDGRWDFQDILDKLNSGAAPSEPVEDKPADLSFLQGAKIAKLSLIDASIRIDDAALGRPLAVEKLNINLSDIALGQALAMTLTAELVDGQQRSPITLKAGLAALPKDLNFAPLPDINATLRVETLALVPWGALLAADSLQPSAGRLDVDLQVSAKDDASALLSRGYIEVKGLVLSQNGARGQALDMRLDVDSEFDQRAPFYRVKNFKLLGAGVDLKASLDASNLSARGLKQAEIKLSVGDLARVLATLPTGQTLLPSELVLDGPMRASFVGNASSMDLGLNLDAAHVAWAKSFNKKAGNALHLELQAKRQGQRIEIPKFELSVDQANLKGSAKLGTGANAPIEATLNTGKIRIATLKDLLPDVAKALQKGERVDGEFTLSAKASIRDGKQQAKASLDLSGFDLNLPSLQAKGGGNIVASLDPSASGRQLKLKAKLDKLSLISLSSSGEKQLDKPAGMPMSLDIDLDQGKTKTTVRQAQLSINKSLVQASGGAESQANDAINVDIKLDRIDLQFDDLRRCLPGAGDLPAGGRLLGQAQVSGDPDINASLAAQMQIESLVYDQAQIKGRLGIKNLDAPQFDFDLQSPALDIDQLLGEEETAQPESKGDDSVDDNPHGLSKSTREMLATVSGQGLLHVGKAKFKGLEMAKFVGKLRMTKGVVEFDALDFDIYGGHISAAGSRFDLPKTYTGYTLKMKTDNVDLGQALSANTDLGPIFAGRIKQDIDVSGYGLSGQDLATTLDGPTSLKTSTLRIKTLDLLGPINAALKAALAKAGTKNFKGFSSGGGTDLRDLNGWIKFAKGKFKLKKPVKSKTSFGALELRGGGALDGTLDLQSVVMLAPAVVNKAFGRKLATQDIQVPLNIGGTWKSPTVTGVDVKALLSSVLGSQASAALNQAKDLAKQEIDKAKDQAKKAADQTRARAEAEARRQADAAKSKVEAERKRAEAEAKRRANEAKKVAEQKRREAEAKARAEANKRKKAAEKAARDKAKKAKEEAKKRAQGLFGL